MYCFKTFSGIVDISRDISVNMINVCFVLLNMIDVCFVLLNMMLSGLKHIMVMEINLES